MMIVHLGVESYMVTTFAYTWMRPIVKRKVGIGCYIERND